MVMCVTNTPVVYYPELGIWVKHEHECCPGGPNFSKTRGVFAHLSKVDSSRIGVLDTSHSQGGWAVARACSLLGKSCVLFYPWYKGQTKIPPQQLEAQKLGAELIKVSPGRSAILYHAAKKSLAKDGGYFMPNALKLPESVTETAAEFMRTEIPEQVTTILVSASSGTIAAGVVLGVRNKSWKGQVLVHMGYSRSLLALMEYIGKMSGKSVIPDFFNEDTPEINFIDEDYSYSDSVRERIDLPFPSNIYYDRKAVLWYLRHGQHLRNKTLLWNIG